MDLARELRTLIRRPVLGSPQARARVLHGDWHPLVRDPIDLLRLSLVVGAFVFLVLGDIGAAVRMATSALAALLVRALDPPRRFDLAFVVAISLNGWGGAFDLFNQLDWYDNLVHVTLPMAVGPLAYLALVRLEVVPAFSSANTARHRIGMAIVACTLGLSAAAIYEIYEWVLVYVFGSNKFVSESDTVNDLFDGVVGAAVGGYLLARLALTDTGTRRVELSGEAEPAVAPGDAERGHDPGGADRGDDRVAVERGAAEDAVQDDPRRGPDGDPDDERARADTREAAGVVEGAGGEARRAADERDAPGAAALQPGGDAAGTVRQPVGERRWCQPARDRERGEGSQRTADEAQHDARRPEQRDGQHVQHGPGEQQARRRDPGGDEEQRRPDPGGRHEAEPRVRVVREQQDGGDGREEQRRHDGETP